MTAFDYIVSITGTSGTVTLTSTPFDIRQPDLTSGKHSDETVTNTLEIRLTDGSPQANSAELSTLNTLLHNAHLRHAENRREIDPVYLMWQGGTAATAWRSEIISGNVSWDRDALTWPYWSGDTQFSNLNIERYNYWDGPEGTLTTGGSINNTTNYLDIAGTLISGDLPGPVRLELTNTLNEEYRHSSVFVGVSQMNIDGFPELLGGTAYAGTVPQGTEVTVGSWTLTADELSAAAGRPFKFIAAGKSGNTGTMYRLRIYWNVTELYTSGWVCPSPTIEIWELGAIPIPPWLPGLDDMGSVDIELRIYNPVTAINSGYTLTELYALPTDQYRALVPAGYGLPYSYRLIVDDIDGNLYVDSGADADKVGHYNAQAGNPLTVLPGVDHRFVFLVTKNTNVSDISGRTSAVTIKYRPRRLSV